MIDLSVVIPAYQESQRLPPTLERIRDYLETRALSWEVIVVDDGSTDGTAEAARKVGLEQLRLIEFPENRGKGAAIRAGVMQSRGESVLLTDADLATPIEELEKLEQHRSGAPIVFASRALASSRIDRRQPPHREWLGRIFNRILRLLGAADIRDTQ